MARQRGALQSPASQRPRHPDPQPGRRSRPLPVDLGAGRRRDVTRSGKRAMRRGTPRSSPTARSRRSRSRRSSASRARSRTPTTGRPIEKVTAIPVVDNPHGRLIVDRQHKKVFPGGVYTIEGDRNRTDVAYRVRIEAEGYRTAMSDAVRVGAPQADLRFPARAGAAGTRPGRRCAGPARRGRPGLPGHGLADPRHREPGRGRLAVQPEGRSPTARARFPSPPSSSATPSSPSTTTAMPRWSREPDQQPGELALRAWAQVEGRLMEAGQPVPSVMDPLRAAATSSRPASPHIQDGILGEDRPRPAASSSPGSRR